MMVVGHGLDLAETQRVADLLERHGRRFVTRCFTDVEQAYCEANPRRRAEHYAGRFAAKEAVLKALGTGLSQGINWTDITVQRLASGKPEIVLNGVAAKIADDMGVTAWMLSITHVKGMAAASALALGSGAQLRGGAATHRMDETEDAT